MATINVEFLVDIVRETNGDRMSMPQPYTMAEKKLDVSSQMSTLSKIMILFFLEEPSFAEHSEHIVEISASLASPGFD